jgi:hypothetical protein
MPTKSKPDDVDFHEETDSPTYADDRNFYKVEKWLRHAAPDRAVENTAKPLHFP